MLFSLLWAGVAATSSQPDTPHGGGIFLVTLQVALPVLTLLMVGPVVLVMWMLVKSRRAVPLRPRLGWLVGVAAAAAMRKVFVVCTG